MRARGFLCWLVLIPCVAAADLDGEGRGGPKTVNLTGEEFPRFPTSYGEVKGATPRPAGCEEAACAALYRSPAFDAQLLTTGQQIAVGKATYHFGPDGHPRFAVIEQGDTAKVLQRFELRELGVIYVLEVGRGKKTKAGWRFEQIPGAVKVIHEAYLKDLRFPTRAGGQKVYEAGRWLEHRIDDAIHTGIHTRQNPPLLVEAVQWLGDAALPLLEAGLVDPKIDEFEIAPAVAAICQGGSAALQALVKEKITPERGGFTSAAILGCLEDAAVEVVRPYVMKLIAAYCLGPVHLLQTAPVLHAWALRLKIYDQFLQAGNRCTSPKRREVIKVCVQPEVPQDSVERALAQGGPEEDEAILDCLDAERLPHRLGVSASLSREEVARKRSLEFLSATKAVPTADELFGVAVSYSREPPPEGKEFHQWRALALEYFARAKGDALLTQSSRQALATALEREEAPPKGALDQLAGAVRGLKRLGQESFAPALRVGLAVLGERDLELAAAVGAKTTIPKTIEEVDDRFELAAYGLGLCGCDKADIAYAIQLAKGDPKQRGVICGR